MLGSKFFLARFASGIVTLKTQKV